jgi:hypothetical protein
MNSVSFREIMQATESGTVGKESGEQARKEDITISEGDLIDQLVHHGGWQLVERKLKEVIEDLNAELKDVNRCDTLRKVQNRQVMINTIELFLKSPKDFIEKRNLILARRQKWQNKKS